MGGKLAKIGFGLLALITALVAWSISYSDEADDRASHEPASSAIAPVTTTDTGQPSSDESTPAEPTTAATLPQRPDSAEPDADTSTGETAAQAEEVREPEPEPQAKPESELWTVTAVVDGDTIDVRRDATTERVRIIGIDTPERGQCGYAEATQHMEALVGGSQVDLVTAGAGKDERDRYGRILRYVIAGNVDAGYEQIAAGLAIARYDSRDGYGAHPRETAYIEADDATPAGYPCADGDEPADSPNTPAPESDDPAADQPWNKPGPDLDCGDIGHKVEITGTDYHRLDADGDGWGCDSYG